MDELAKLSIAQARKSLLKKEFKATELTDACVKAARSSTSLNAYCEITDEIAIEQARTADKEFASKTAKILSGIPIGVKDIFCTKGVKTQAASNILTNFISVNKLKLCF